MLQNLSAQFSSITRGGFFFVRLQTETCSQVLGIFRECGTVFYRVRYGAVHTFSHTHKYPYPHDRRANKDSYPHDRNVTDDLCSLI